MQHKEWSLDELIEYLKKEQELPSRFPVRVIFANSFSAYIELIDKLTNISDNIISLERFCKGPDILPDLDALKDELITTNTLSNVVLSIGEYLRLSRIVERNWSPKFKALFNLQQQPISTKRLWLPLYCASYLFEELVGNVDIRHENDVFYIKPINSEEPFDLKVYSQDFTNIIKGENVINGIKSWINIWDQKIKDTKFSLITKQYKMIEESDGIYSVDIISDAYKYICSNLANVNLLKREWGSNKCWAELSRFSAIEGIDKMLLSALNIIEYDPYSLLSSWDVIGDFKKWVTWLWNKIHVSDDYVSYAINRSQSYKEIDIQLESALFNMPQKNESLWLAQRALALRCLHTEVLSDAFWIEFNKISDNYQRLKYLTDQTTKEKVAIIKTVSLLLRGGKSPEEIVDLLNGKYPDLCEYLLPSYKYESHELNNYFTIYRIQKLKDEFDYIKTQDAIKSMSTYVWSFATRGSILERYSNKVDTMLLCIDGMGIEWLGLLLMKIKKKSSVVPKKVFIATAKLPTVTETNWPLTLPGITMDKLNQLDDISHDKTDSTTTDYSLIVSRQIAIFDDFVDKIITLYYNHKTLIVTADHGLSRMAALAFHQVKGTDLPPGAEAKNLGRYCILKDKSQNIASTTNIERDNEILVFRNYEHFTSSGRANGELHGGATPEELLVPVIILENPDFQVLNETKADVTIACYLKGDRVKRTNLNTVELELIFNRPVMEVEARIGKNFGSVTRIDSSRCLIVFADLNFQSYKLQIIADGILLNEDLVFTVERKGLQINDDI